MLECVILGELGIVELKVVVVVLVLFIFEIFICDVLVVWFENMVGFWWDGEVKCYD